MNYLIFGGSGFIGTHLIHRLKDACVKPGDCIYDLDLVMPGEEGVVPGIVEKNEGRSRCAPSVPALRLCSSTRRQLSGRCSRHAIAGNIPGA